MYRDQGTAKLANSDRISGSLSVQEKQVREGPQAGCQGIKQFAALIPSPPGISG